MSEAKEDPVVPVGEEGLDDEEPVVPVGEEGLDDEEPVVPVGEEGLDDEDDAPADAAHGAADAAAPDAAAASPDAALADGAASAAGSDGAPQDAAAADGAPQDAAAAVADAPTAGTGEAMPAAPVDPMTAALDAAAASAAQNDAGGNSAEAAEAAAPQPPVDPRSAALDAAMQNTQAPAQPPVDPRSAALDAAMQKSDAPAQPPVDPRSAALDAAMQKSDAPVDPRTAALDAAAEEAVTPVGEEGLDDFDDENGPIVPVGEEGLEDFDGPIVPVGEEDIVGLDATPTPPPMSATPSADRSRSRLTEGTMAEEEDEDTLLAEQEALNAQYQDEESDEEEFDDGPSFEELQDLYMEALAEKEKLATTNGQLQNKIAEQLKSRKTMTEERRSEDVKAVHDMEQRYQKCLETLDDLHDELSRDQASFDRQATELKMKVEEREAKAAELLDTFAEFKRQIFVNAENSRTGKPIPSKAIIQFEQKDSVKDQEVSKVRLKNVALRNQLRKLEGTLRQKEELAEGLHLIDFEQLKIENQTFNEKIEERNEELLKLRKKTTQTVQVLTHLKEKLQFVQSENQNLKLTLAELEQEVTANRDALNKVKKLRDKYRSENTEIKQHSGLVSTEELAKDFELGKLDLDAMRNEFAELKARHADLTLQIKEIEKKTTATLGYYAQDPSAMPF